MENNRPQQCVAPHRLHIPHRSRHGEKGNRGVDSNLIRQAVNNYLQINQPLLRTWVNSTTDTGQLSKTIAAFFTKHFEKSANEFFNQKTGYFENALSKIHDEKLSISKQFSEVSAKLAHLQSSLQMLDDSNRANVTKIDGLNGVITSFQNAFEDRITKSVRESNAWVERKMQEVGGNVDKALKKCQEIQKIAEEDTAKPDHLDTESWMHTFEIRWREALEQNLKDVVKSEIDQMGRDIADKAGELIRMEIEKNRLHLEDVTKTTCSQMIEKVQEKQASLEIKMGDFQATFSQIVERLIQGRISSIIEDHTIFKSKLERLDKQLVEVEQFRTGLEANQLQSLDKQGALISMLTTKAADMKQQLDRVEAKMREDSTGVLSQLTSRENTINSVVIPRIDALENTVNLQAPELKSTKNSLQTLKAEVETAAKNLKKGDDLLKKVNEAAKTLQSKVKNLTEKCETVKTDVRNLASKVKKLENATGPGGSVSTQLETIKNSNDEKIKENASETVKLKEKIDLELGGLKSRLGQLSETGDTAHASLNQKMVEIGGSVEGLRNKLKNVEETSQAFGQRLSALVGGYGGNLEAVTSQLDDLQSRVEAETRRIQDFESRLVLEVETVQAQREILEESLNHRLTEWEKLADKKDAAAQEKSSQLKKEYENLLRASTLDLDTIKTQVKGCCDKVSGIEQQLVEIGKTGEEKYSQVKSDFGKATDSLMSSVKELQTTIEGFPARLGTVQNDVKAAMECCSRLEAWQKDVNSRLTFLQSTDDELDQKLDSAILEESYPAILKDNLLQILENDAVIKEEVVKIFFDETAQLQKTAFMNKLSNQVLTSLNNIVRAQISELVDVRLKGEISDLKRKFDLISSDREERKKPEEVNKIRRLSYDLEKYFDKRYVKHSPPHYPLPSGGTFTPVPPTGWENPNPTLHRTASGGVIPLNPGKKP